MQLCDNHLRREAWNGFQQMGFFRWHFFVKMFSSIKIKREICTDTHDLVRLRTLRRFALQTAFCALCCSLHLRSARIKMVTQVLNHFWWSWIIPLLQHCFHSSNSRKIITKYVLHHRGLFGVQTLYAAFCTLCCSLTCALPESKWLHKFLIIAHFWWSWIILLLRHCFHSSNSSKASPIFGFPLLSSNQPSCRQIIAPNLTPGVEHLHQNISMLCTTDSSPPSGLLCTRSKTFAPKYFYAFLHQISWEIPLLHPAFLWPLFCTTPTFSNQHCAPHQKTGDAACFC